jgi:hypothetical protein
MGTYYRWKVPIGDVIPLIDHKAAGLSRCWSGTPESPSTGARNTGDINRGYKGLLARVPTVEEAIRATQPTGYGQRHRMIFELCRWLKAIPDLADRGASELRSILEEWHAMALPNVRTKRLSESWADFESAWQLVRYPIGSGSAVYAMECAMAKELPLRALAYKRREKQILVALCSQLQLMHGDQPFFLACRMAAELLGTNDYGTVSRWLKGFCNDEVIGLVKEYPRSHRLGNEYRYLGDI